MIFIKFTPLEKSIISDRLELFDCLADALADDGFARDEVADAAEQIARTWLIGTNVQRAVIADCVDGSTYFASARDALNNGKMTRGTFDSLRRAARRIEAKLMDHGIDAAFPMF